MVDEAAVRPEKIGCGCNVEVWVDVLVPLSCEGPSSDEAAITSVSCLTRDRDSIVSLVVDSVVSVHEVDFDDEPPGLEAAGTGAKVDPSVHADDSYELVPGSTDVSDCVEESCSGWLGYCGSIDVVAMASVLTIIVRWSPSGGDAAVSDFCANVLIVWAPVEGPVGAMAGVGYADGCWPWCMSMPVDAEPASSDLVACASLAAGEIDYVVS